MALFSRSGDRLLSIAQARDLLAQRGVHVCTATVKRWAAQGRIPGAWKVNANCWVIPERGLKGLARRRAATRKP